MLYFACNTRFLFGVLMLLIWCCNQQSAYKNLLANSRYLHMVDLTSSYLEVTVEN